ncbi:TOBE domain-containing protein [Streptomyces sp. NPDC001698]|uniref:TOBE domain-containing protein n=1 Tax=unclassified Streptomyces TaxID=2593676 RepID=UPI00368871E5
MSCAIRPDDVRVARRRMNGYDLPPKVLAAIEGGGWRRFQVETGHGVVLMSTGGGRASEVADGDEVFVTFDDGALMLFDPELGSRI